MRIRLFGALVVVASLAVPGAGLAAGRHGRIHTHRHSGRAKAIKPADGTYKGTAKWSFNGHSQTDKLTITVAKGQITQVQLLGVTPLDKKHSKGAACGGATDYATNGDKRTGGMSSTAHFSYTWFGKNKTKTYKTTDTEYLAGRFTAATHMTGTWRDVFTDTFSNKKLPSMHCDTGKLAFTAAHS
jgi:major membrane immunogen (membrane-anchored lipoprotein)